MYVCAKLNNYQIGSYAHKVLSNKIVSETRIDKSHTIVKWNGLTKSEADLLSRLVKVIMKY